MGSEYYIDNHEIAKVIFRYRFFATCLFYAFFGYFLNSCFNDNNQRLLNTINYYLHYPKAKRACFNHYLFIDDEERNYFIINRSISYEKENNHQVYYVPLLFDKMIGISNSICLLFYYCFFLFSSIGYLIFFTRGYFFLKEIFSWHFSSSPFGKGIGGYKCEEYHYSYDKNGDIKKMTIKI